MKLRITLTFLVSAFMLLNMNAQVIWGGPGDPNGEFDGGLNDWTTVGLSSSTPDSAVNAVWFWDADANPNMGAYAGTGSVIESPSAANGAAVFESDFLDNGGVAGAFGSGSAPSPHSGALISPIIDCSGNDNVTVTFNQAYRNFDTQNVDTRSLLEVSNDGGVTFTTFEVNANALTNQTIPFRNTFYRVNITDVAANQDSVVIRFVFDGDYYFWMIDDVAVIQTPELDLGLDDMWYSPQFASTPVSQLDAVDHEFAVDIFNTGTADQYDVQVAATIVNADLETMFTDTMTIDTLLSRDTIFYIFDTLVNAATTDYAAVGEYSVLYELFPGENDLEGRDNLVGENFSVTEDLYSFDRGLGQTSNIGSFWIGAIYHTGSWEDSGNGSFSATKIFPEEASGSGTITGTVFRINDDIAANYDNFAVDADLTVIADHPSMTPVGFFIHEVEAAGTQSVDLIDLETDEAGITLLPDSRYLFIFTMEDGMRVQFDRSIDYFQTTTVVYVPGDQLYLGGFGESYGLLAPVELSFFSSVKDTELPATTLNVYPNPAADLYNVDLNFDKATDVSVLLTGVDGKIFKMEKLSRVTQLQKQYDTSNLVSGTYIVRILTEEGVRNQKLVIQK